jgi:hypothetical protein
LHYAAANDYEIGAILFGGLSNDSRDVACCQRDFQTRAGLLLQPREFFGGHIKQSCAESPAFEFQTSGRRGRNGMH